ncbi:MAG: ATP-dependent sacrificial sulfur transferase LarE [Actinomycetota bacterium]
MPTDKRYELLKKELQKYPYAVVAFSGGTDSSLLLSAARDALGDNVLALTWQSEVTPDAEIKAAMALAAKLGVSQQILSESFLSNKQAAANTDDRCYHCRAQMYEVIKKAVKNVDGAVVMEGVNTDDLNDYRPGLKAAAEAGIVHPLVDVGLSKKDIRQIAKKIGLPNWDKEAAPCLASRVAYGQRITTDRLSRVDAAEMIVRDMGFHKVRVRLLDDIHARIEVSPEEVPAARARSMEISDLLCNLGFARVEIDEKGYRQGSLNDDRKQRNNG